MNIKDRVKCKNFTLKNRVVHPPMATSRSDENGHVTEAVLDYYREKTQFKAFSVVIVEHSYVEKRGIAAKGQTSIADDSDIEGMSKVAKIIKENEAIAILQISHAGCSARSKLMGMPPVSPSGIMNPYCKSTDTPVALTLPEIERLRQLFIDAAIRAYKAGFDGVELHSAHGYLLNQFLSPITNKREDKYGGDIYSRIRLHLEIISGIRKELGEKFSIFVRMGAGDFVDGGLSEEDAVTAALEFEKAGVEVLDISGGICFYSIKDSRAGYFDVISKPIFDAVSIPVILTGGVKKGSDIVDILGRDVCDLVGVGRSLYQKTKWIKNELVPLLVDKEDK